MYLSVCQSTFTSFYFTVVTCNHIRYWSSQPEVQTTEYHNIIKDTEKPIGNLYISKVVASISQFDNNKITIKMY